MAITTAEFHAKMYELLDQVLETGIPLHISYKGRTLVIATEEVGSKLAGLLRRSNVIIGDPEALVHMEWLVE